MSPKKDLQEKFFPCVSGQYRSSRTGRVDLKKRSSRKTLCVKNLSKTVKNLTHGRLSFHIHNGVVSHTLRVHYKMTYQIFLDMTDNKMGENISSPPILHSMISTVTRILFALDANPGVNTISPVVMYREFFISWKHVPFSVLP
jgi:hypothetical protein